jgi:hypothetical protein
VFLRTEEAVNKCSDDDDLQYGIDSDIRTACMGCVPTCLLAVAVCFYSCRSFSVVVTGISRSEQEIFFFACTSEITVRSSHKNFIKMCLDGCKVCKVFVALFVVI